MSKLMKVAIRIIIIGIMVVFTGTTTAYLNTFIKLVDSLEELAGLPKEVRELREELKAFKTQGLAKGTEIVDTCVVGREYIEKTCSIGKSIFKR